MRPIDARRVYFIRTIFRSSTEINKDYPSYLQNIRSTNRGNSPFVPLLFVLCSPLLRIWRIRSSPCFPEINYQTLRRETRFGSRNKYPFLPPLVGKSVPAESSFSGKLGWVVRRHTEEGGRRKKGKSCLCRERMKNVWLDRYHKTNHLHQLNTLSVMTDYFVIWPYYCLC